MGLPTTSLTLLTVLIFIGVGVATAPAARANTVTTLLLTHHTLAGQVELEPVHARHSARYGHSFQHRSHRTRRYSRYPYYSRYGYYPRRYRSYGRNYAYRYRY